MSLISVLMVTLLCSISQSKRVDLAKHLNDALTPCPDLEDPYILNPSDRGPFIPNALTTKGWSDEKAYWDCGPGLRIMECNTVFYTLDNDKCITGRMSKDRTMDAECRDGQWWKYSWPRITPTCASFSALVYKGPYYSASPWVAAVQETWTTVRRYKFASGGHPSTIMVNVFKPGEEEPRNHRCYHENVNGCELQCSDHGSSLLVPPFGYRKYWEAGVFCQGTFYFKRKKMGGVIPQSDDQVSITVLLAQDQQKVWGKDVMVAAQETYNGKEGPWWKVELSSEHDDMSLGDLMKKKVELTEGHELSSEGHEGHEVSSEDSA